MRPYRAVPVASPPRLDEASTPPVSFLTSRQNRAKPVAYKTLGIGEAQRNRPRTRTVTRDLYLLESFVHTRRSRAGAGGDEKGRVWREGGQGVAWPPVTAEALPRLDAAEGFSQCLIETVPAIELSRRNCTFWPDFALRRLRCRSLDPATLG